MESIVTQVDRTTGAHYHPRPPTPKLSQVEKFGSFVTFCLCCCRKKRKRSYSITHGHGHGLHGHSHPHPQGDRESASTNKSDIPFTMSQGSSSSVPVPSDLEHTFVPLLPHPQLHRTEVGKSVLVIDLDETLVHSSFKAVEKPDLIVPVEIDGIVHDVFVLKRPYVDDFLRRMGQLYECVLFTGNYVKDLDKLGRDLNRVIIIDNSPVCYGFHPDNAVPILSWFDDMSDTELLYLIPFFERLSNVKNVYSVLRNSNHPFHTGDGDSEPTDRLFNYEILH